MCVAAVVDVVEHWHVVVQERAGMFERAEHELRRVVGRFGRFNNETGRLWIYECVEDIHDSVFGMTPSA